MSRVAISTNDRFGKFW